jgi:putative peptidoglycan lipid II flippase
VNQAITSSTPDSAPDPATGPLVPLGEQSLERATWMVSGLTALSRLTGFVRVLVVTAVLGRTALGDVYQSVNLVPNVMFELLAAGLLQAVLLPTLVGATARRGIARSDEIANVVLGWVLLGLAIVAALLALLTPVVVNLLFAAEPDSGVEADKVALGIPFLLVFVPQLLCYGGGLVATAVLHARHRFAPPAFAPLVNNVVVIACYLVFDRMRDGAAPSLDLTPGQIAVLAGGTTLGVLAFTAVPLIAATRAGVHWRPALRRDEPELAGLPRAGAWAGLTLALTQVLTVAVLVLGNGVAGSVPTFYFAFAIFQLPYALVAIPVATTRAPYAARLVVDDDPARAATLIRDGLTSTVALLAVAGAAMVALAWPVARLLAFGETAGSDLAPLAHAIAAFGPGLAGYGALFYLMRIGYAVGMIRWPAAAAAATAALGVVAMIVASAAAPEAERAAVLAACYGGAPAIGAVILAIALSRRLGYAVASLSVVAAALVAAAVTGVVMAALALAVDATSRAASLTTLVLAGAGGVAVGVLVFPLLTRRPLRVLLAGRSA